MTGYADPRRLPDGYLMLHKPFNRADLAAKVSEAAAIGRTGRSRRKRSRALPMVHTGRIMNSFMAETMQKIAEN